jgi:hypothetical protein
MDGFADPFSICDSIFRVISPPQSCRWDNPASSRACRSRCPNSTSIPSR